MEPLRSPRSAVVAHRPPRSMGRLWQFMSAIKSPLSPSCLFCGFPLVMGMCPVVLAGAESFGGRGGSCADALKPTVGVTVGAVERLCVYPGGARGVRVSERMFLRVDWMLLGLAGRRRRFSVWVLSTRRV